MLQAAALAGRADLAAIHRIGDADVGWHRPLLTPAAGAAMM
jgi:hypothetical protein